MSNSICDSQETISEDLFKNMTDGDTFSSQSSVVSNKAPVVALRPGRGMLNPDGTMKERIVSPFF